MLLHTIAVTSLTVSGLCSALILIDIARGRTQRMWIMNIVWPVTALYSGPVGLWAYVKVGRPPPHGGIRKKPFWQSVGLSAMHCGSGCTLGDILAEWYLFLAPATLFGSRIYAAWALDYVLAFSIGIGFQYFTIVPMRHLTVKKGIVAALKADTLSLSAWQIGMYGWMAIAVFGIFGHEVSKTDPVFWFMMQIAMLLGFATSYPVNWWLLRRGIKEQM